MKHGWEVKKLGEVCEVKGGSTPLKSNKAFWENGNIPWFTVDDIREQGRIIHSTHKFVTELGATKLYIYPKDTILLCCTASVGEYAITKIETTSNQQFNGLIIRDRHKIKPEYLFHFVSTLKNQLLGLSGKTTIDFVSAGKIKSLEIPIPSMSEQERIVGILDSAFAKIEALRANAQQNLQNTKDLFQASLKQELSPKQRWKSESVKGISKDIFAGGDAPKDNFSEKPTEKYGIPIYANAVKDDGLYGYTDFARVTEPSLTIAARGSGTGYVLEREEPYLPIVRLIVIIPKYEQILLRYLYYSFKGLYITRSGSAIPQLTVPMIKNYTISFPSISVQQAIVEKLDALSERCRAMEENYRQTITHCNDLKQALLTKAFNGEL